RFVLSCPLSPPFGGRDQGASMIRALTLRAVLGTLVATGGSVSAGQVRMLHRTVDLNLGEAAEVQLHDGSTAKVKLLAVRETRDSVRSAVREARVEVEINGRAATLVSGNYRLPVPVGGVQVDCPATRGLYRNRDPWEDSWGLDKDARLRLWPAGSSWM